MVILFYLPKKKKALLYVLGQLVCRQIWQCNVLESCDVFFFLGCPYIWSVGGQGAGSARVALYTAV
jgi:hypothetical protein